MSNCESWIEIAALMPLVNYYLSALLGEHRKYVYIKIDKPPNIKNLILLEKKMNEVSELKFLTGFNLFREISYLLVC